MTRTNFSGAFLPQEVRDMGHFKCRYIPNTAHPGKADPTEIVRLVDCARPEEGTRHPRRLLDLTLHAICRHNGETVGECCDRTALYRSTLSAVATRAYAFFRICFDICIAHGRACSVYKNRRRRHADPTWAKGSGGTEQVETEETHGGFAPSVATVSYFKDNKMAAVVVTMPHVPTQATLQQVLLYTLTESGLASSLCLTCLRTANVRFRVFGRLLYGLEKRLAGGHLAFGRTFRLRISRQFPPRLLQVYPVYDDEGGTALTKNMKSLRRAGERLARRFTTGCLSHWHLLGTNHPEAKDPPRPDEPEDALKITVTSPNSPWLGLGYYTQI